MIYTLFDHQEDCVNGLRVAYKQKFTAPLLVSPVGSGKTVMFGYMAQSADANGKRVLIMAHRKELCTQCGEKLMSYGVQFGYINPKFTPDYNRRVQVGTVQTIIDRKEKMTMWDGAQKKRVLWVPDLIIIDEAHRTIAKTYINIINFYKAQNPKLLILGVTATPKRGDGKGMDAIYDIMVQGPQIDWLIQHGFLSKVKTFGPEHVLDLNDVEIGTNGDYNKAQLERAVSASVIIGDAVANYTRVCPGAPAVAFCVTIKEAQKVAQQFRAAGYLFEHIDGEMSDAERSSILKRLENREIHGITSVDLVTEGFDAPVLQCAIMLRPTRSLSLFIQMCGRVLRFFKGKDMAYILDHASMTEAHGWVDDPRVWTLAGEDEEEKKKKRRRNPDKVPTKMCPECRFVNKQTLGLGDNKRFAPKCTNCGHEFEKRERELIHIEGNLVELPRRHTPVTEEDKAEYGELERLAIESGKGLSWAVDIWDSWQDRLTSA